METSTTKKTKAALIRDAKSGRLQLSMSLSIPDKRVGDGNILSVIDGSGDFLVVKDSATGAKSRIALPNSALISYSETTLSIFIAGYRDLNADERRFFADYLSKKQSFKTMYDLGEKYAFAEAKNNFFVNAGFGYLLGGIKERGLQYFPSSNKVRDDSIIGGVDSIYSVSFIDPDAKPEDGSVLTDDEVIFLYQNYITQYLKQPANVLANSPAPLSLSEYAQGLRVSA